MQKSWGVYESEQSCWLLPGVSNRCCTASPVLLLVSSSVFSLSRLRNSQLGSPALHLLIEYLYVIFMNSFAL